MKFTTKLVAGCLSAGLLTATFAQSNTPAPAQDSVKFNIPNVATPAAAPGAPAVAPVVAAPAPKFSEDQLLEIYGYMLGARMGIAELEFTPTQVEAIARGMHMVAAGKIPAVDAQAIQPELEAFLGKKQQAFLLKVRNRNLAETAAYFTKLKQDNKNVQELPSGLRLEVLKAGTGAVPKPGQLAKIHYTGSFINGQVFDSSVQ
ncbi:MAG: FKBP-type peptidyl-prolyl cis-trans isomerase, partial [Opitutales bacterium]